MQINTNFVIYTLSIGLFMALHYTWFKMIKWNPSVSLFWIYLILTIINFIIVYFSSDKLFSKEIQGNFLWILLIWIMIGLFVYLTIKGFQNWFNLVLFPLSNTIISTIFLVVINYFIFKNNLSIYNIFWLFLWILSIYFLSIN